MSDPLSVSAKPKIKVSKLKLIALSSLDARATLTAASFKCRTENGTTLLQKNSQTPFIPTENEVDQPIGGCNKRMAAFPQLLKETGVRSGEACELKWTDIDTENPSV